MTRKARIGSPTTAAAATPIERSLFSPPALLKGEDEKAYNELLLQVSSAVKPADTIEHIWVSDFVAWTWELIRWRRLKAALLTAQAPEGLRQILRRLVDHPDEAEQLAANWARGHSPSMKKIDRLLGLAELTMDAVLAETLATRFDDIERIERLETTAEHRRNAALREIEHHRANFASSLRPATATIEDGAFKVVAPKSAPTLPGEPP